MNIEKKITQSFEKQTFMKTIGAQLDLIEDGHVTISVALKPGMMQQHGFGHAGITFSIGDSAAGYSALTMMEPDLEVMTAEIKMNLLSPADGDFLRAEGRVVKSGKRLIVVTSEVHAHKGGNSKLIALMQGTMVPVPLS